MTVINAMRKIIVYTDGSSGNKAGKAGGIGAVLFYGKQRREIQKGYGNTSNNRMEVTAVIESLKIIKAKHIPVVIHSDSQYVVFAFTHGWIKGWEGRKWEGVKNADLWQELTKLKRMFNSVTFVWVKGHADNEWNNYCDKLASEAKRIYKENEDK